MEVRPFEIKLISATDLKNVNTFSKMNVYVTAYITTDPRTVHRTPIHKDGGTNPTWKSHSIQFTIQTHTLTNPDTCLSLIIISDRTLGDKEIGRVHIPLKELSDSFKEAEDQFREVEYKVRRPSGRVQGTIKLAYKFGESYTQKSVPAQPVMAYPAGGVGSSSSGGYQVPSGGYYSQAGGVGVASAAYHPPGGGSGYHQYPPQYPPQYTPQPYQQPYAAPPPPPPQYGYNPYGQGAGYGGGYGYGQPAAAQKPSKGRFGMGSAAMGLGAGLLGGLLVGEMVEDVAEAAAFDDYGDYDGGGMFDM